MKKLDLAASDAPPPTHPNEPWRLPDDVSGLHAFLADHDRGQLLTRLTTHYWLLQSLVLALLLFRLETKMRFHRALGVTSATLIKAAAPLAHFFVVFVYVQAAAAVLGVIWFGLEHDNFSSLGRAAVSVFSLGVLGDFGEIHEVISGSFFYKSDAEQLPAGLFSSALALMLFTVLQNFLLAILGDSYVAVHAVTRHTVPLYTHLWKEKPVRAMRRGWAAQTNTLIAVMHRVYTGDDSKGRHGRDNVALNRNFNDIVRAMKQTKHLAHAASGSQSDFLTAKRLLAQMVSYPPQKLFNRSSSMKRLGLVPTDSIKQTELQLASPVAGNLLNKFGAMIRTNSVMMVGTSGTAAGMERLRSRLHVLLTEHAATALARQEEQAAMRGVKLGRDRKAVKPSRRRLAVEHAASWVDAECRRQTHALRTLQSRHLCVPLLTLTWTL